MPRKSMRNRKQSRKSRKSHKPSRRHVRIRKSLRNHRGGSAQQSFEFRVSVFSQVGLPEAMTDEIAESICAHLQAKKGADTNQLTNIQFHHDGQDMFRVTYTDKYANMPFGLDISCEYLTKLSDNVIFVGNVEYLISIHCMNANMNVNTDMQSA